MTRLRRKSPVVQSLIDENTALTNRVRVLCRENFDLLARIAGMTVANEQVFEANEILCDKINDLYAELGR